MPFSSLIRRSVALAGGAGIVTALALVPAGSANAQIQAQVGAEAQSDVTYTGSGGGTCNLTSPTGSDDVSSPMKVVTKAGTFHRTVKLNAQYTNSLDSGDQVRVKGAYASKTVLKKHKKDLASVTLTGQGKLTVSHAALGPSECAGSGSAYGMTQVMFTEHRAGHLVLTRATQASALSLAVIQNLKTNRLLSLDIYSGDQSHSVSKVAIKPGSYALIAESGITIGNEGGGIPLKRATGDRTAALKSGLNLTFVPKKK